MDSPFNCLLFDLDDTLYPSSTGIAQGIKKNIDDFLIEKCGMSATKASNLRVELFKTYGSTLVGLRALGYDIDADDYHGLQARKKSRKNEQDCLSFGSADELNRGYFDDMPELKQHSGKLPIVFDASGVDASKLAVPEASLVCLSFRANSQAMVDSWRKPFYDAFTGHRRSQSALVEREVVPQISDVATVAAASAAPTTTHGIEVAVEFKPVEHPIEPLDNDQPIQYLFPEPSILNDGRIWKERVSASVRRRADLPVMQDGGTLQSQSESEATVGTKPRPTSNRMILPSLSAPEHNLLAP
ncbi:hypothetical protein J1N35_003004 [Gossypium stocksii]|uniref:Uncharacterized protein n=1 Tax=Gossypium stocksii TaxID=47602 RepID=A0A9D4AN61_9ROSI|nr:hypothetical protein J1N35_003004 [Gossypium stocksii]